MAKTSITNNRERAFIQRYFAPLAAEYPGAYALQDDCAALTVEAGHQLITTVDAVAAGVHFFADDCPSDIAWKALAVNVSDLVAKGARPLAYLMSLALPGEPDQHWMQDFADGLSQAQSTFAMHLAGGDTDIRDGPLTITITAFGQLPTGTMIERSGSEPGDRLFVTGTIGDSFLGLQLRHSKDDAIGAKELSANDRQVLLQRYLRPAPRVELYQALNQMARASIDVSDGLIKDIASLATASGVGAEIDAPKVPISRSAAQMLRTGPYGLDDLLTAGGDYEVVAAVAGANADAFQAEADKAGIAVTDIGVVTLETGVKVKEASGALLRLDETGYDHFSNRG
jgi:thiamine-monophosphate kinase